MTELKGFFCSFFVNEGDCNEIPNIEFCTQNNDSVPDVGITAEKYAINSGS